MPRRDWRSYAPFGIGLAVLALLYLIPTLAQNYQSARSADYTATQEYEKSKRVAPFDPSAQSPDADAKAYREEWRAERDLRAQQRMARWSIALFWATFLGVVLVGATLWETRMAAQAATDMVEHAAAANRTTEAALALTREISRAELRPWLVIDTIKVSRIWAWASADDIGLRFTYTIKNVGKLPAMRVRPRYKAIDAVDFDVLREASHTFIEEHISDLNYVDGAILPPGGSRELVDLQISVVATEKSVKEGRVLPVLLIDVLYDAPGIDSVRIKFDMFRLSTGAESSSGLSTKFYPDVGIVLGDMEKGIDWVRITPVDALARMT